MPKVPRWQIDEWVLLVAVAAALGAIVYLVVESLL